MGNASMIIWYHWLCGRKKGRHNEIAEELFKEHFP